MAVQVSLLWDIVSDTVQVSLLWDIVSDTN
jgi:hypothetical protein